LGGEDAFWGELIFGVEKVTGDDDNFVIGGVFLDIFV